MGNKSSEEKEKPLNKYIREKHTQEECIGFIDGFAAGEARIKELELKLESAEARIKELQEENQKLIQLNLLQSEALDAGRESVLDMLKENKKLQEENEKLKIKNVNERFKLQQSYREQFDWIALHYPECYKNIPNPVQTSELLKEFREEIKRKDQLIKEAFFNDGHAGFLFPEKYYRWEEFCKINNIEL